MTSAEERHFPNGFKQVQSQIENSPVKFNGVSIQKTLEYYQQMNTELAEENNELKAKLQKINEVNNRVTEKLYSVKIYANNTP